MDEQHYVQIAENIDQGFQTAPKADGRLSKAFIAYLKLLYSPEEAELVQHIPMMPQSTTAEEVAAAAGRELPDVKSILKQLASKGFINATSGGAYRLPPVPFLLNLHMFYPDIKQDDLEAARLYQQYYIEDKFYKYYATSGKGTPFLRAIPVEKAIDREEKTFTAEEAHEYIKNLQTEDLALVPCPCRTRTEKMDSRECRDRFPVGSCIFIAKNAKQFIELGLGKRVTKEQAIAYLDEMVGLGLIATAENYIQEPHSIMCLCCGCCCSNVRGRTRWDNPTAVLPSHFLPEANDDCIQCGQCVDRCMLDALSLDDDAEQPIVDPEKCIGCGVCAVGCPEEALKLKRFERPEAPFENMLDLGITVARENERL